jgi:hypothetical protein
VGLMELITVLDTASAALVLAAGQRAPGPV